MAAVSPRTQSMIDIVENLPERYFQYFMNIHASKQNDYIACIEGNDECYYDSHCQKYLDSNKIYFLRCDGKNNVLALIEMLEKHSLENYRRAKCFGIVDKDYGLDPPIANKNRVYETSAYSFENFYLSLDCIKKIIGLHFHLKEFCDLSSDFSSVIDIYHVRLKEYIEIIKEVDKKYRATQISAKVLNENLPTFKSDNILLSKKKIKIDLENVTQMESDLFSVDISDSFSEEALNIAAEHYMHDNIFEYAKNIRGKFLLFFIFHFISELKKDMEVCDLKESMRDGNDPVCFVQRRTLRDDPTYNKKLLYKLQVQFNMENFLSVFASCADQPECLKIFLKNFKNNPDYIS